MKEVKVLLDPPFTPGEFLYFGYELHLGSHFALSREEAERRYRSPWTSEGLTIRDPTKKVVIRAFFLMVSNSMTREPYVI